MPDLSLLAIAGLISGMGAIISAWAGLRRSRQEAREEGAEGAREELAEARAEAEGLAAELHRCRMELAQR